MKAEHLVHQAAAFFSAFNRCNKQRPLPDGKVEWLPVPAIVCASFSIEVGFKALILRSGRSARGHKLAELFLELSATDQNLIVKNCGIDRSAFDVALGLASEGFVDWRYYFEKTADLHSNLAFLSKLAAATLDCAKI